MEALLSSVPFLLENETDTWSVRRMSQDVIRRPEDEAMERYALGDEGALAIVYDALAPRLYGFLIKRTHDEPLSEDLLQQAFLQIHRARGTFVKGAAVTPWAFAIVRRLMIDAGRKRARLRKHISESDSAEADEVADVFDLELLVSAGQLGARLTAELAKLPETQRAAFELVRLEGLSMSEAAEVLGTTVSGVKLRAHRAYKALGLALGDEFGPPAQENTKREE